MRSPIGVGDDGWWVGQDAHAHAALLFRLRQVVVELLDVLGVGVEAARGADPALELDERVEGGKVHGAARTLGGRVFFVYLLVLHEAGDGQEVADRAGDVGLGLAFVVAAENLGCGLLVPGIVWIDVQGHWVIYPGLAGGWGLMESGPTILVDHYGRAFAVVSGKGMAGEFVMKGVLRLRSG